ncbi:hypothetical protein F0562_006113 [Nyssa sinensis]|uniref:Uncharacterized protein n=1 Tax=Nyssa sinensis TaxID=561372 RepID=A0A5J5AQT0_9ASTE|nr:hypothetical protein F0562_006113 [Nyssa sinensis]
MTYFQLPTTTATVSKEDLIHIDPFPSDVPSDEYISTVTTESLPEPTSSTVTPKATSPTVTTESTSTPSSPPLLVRSRCTTLPPPDISLPVPSTSEDTDPTPCQYPLRHRQPSHLIEGAY